MNFHRLIQSTCIAAATWLGLDSQAAVTNVFLRAGVTTNTMPDGRAVVMWGFAREDSAAGTSGVISVPGPAIQLPPGNWDLSVSVNNQLPEAVSVMIPNQTGIMGDPVRDPVSGRIRSFTHETAPGAVGVYEFPGLKAGTFLYHSATHPAVQVPMGLFGEMTLLAGSNQAYTNAPVHAAEASFIFSEVDPDLHDAVVSGNYGPGLAMSSTLGSKPQYFFINGVAYTPGMETNSSQHVRLPDSVANTGRVLFRFLNAGIQYRTPVLSGFHLDYRAEDGRFSPYSKVLHSQMMAPLKTMDGYWLAGAPGSRQGTFALFDRNLGLANGAGNPGGMVAYVDVAAGGGSGPEEVNVAPTLAAVADQTVNELVPLNLMLQAADSNTPAQALTFSLDVTAPAGASISESGVFSWIPSEGQGPGTYPITVIVTDSGVPALSARQTFQVTVNEVNSAPVLAAISNRSLVAGQTLAVTNSATDADLPANALVYSLGAAPTGATLTPAGILSWTPTLSQVGTNVFNVAVTDSGVPSLSASQSFQVVVAPYQTNTVNSPLPIVFQSSGNALEYPRNITISGALSRIQDVKITLSQLSHPRPSDLDVMLVGPSGVAVLLMSDCGGANSLTPGQPRTITFSASATTSLSTSAIVNGTYLPTDLAGAPDIFSSPAPTSGWTSNLNTLGDTTANGVWKLYIRDNVAGPNGFAGLLAGGVQLTVRSKP
jgi:Bacterial Ig domain/Multicopper oxidase